MKQFYFSILFLSFGFFISAQTDPTGSSTETGITAGDLSVTLSGGASYNIPILVPPGITGVVPQISLNYDSQTGSGVAGFGWNISGVSSITRIPATKFHDNTIDGVDFNALDRFALDGQRLLKSSSSSTAYGADKTTYDTENFSNLRITSYGVHPSGSNYGPAYFLVEYPDGSKAYYGNSTNSRSITEWSITYFENSQGVRVTYDYNLANNLLEISSIKYGTLTTTAPINSIQFLYETRLKAESYYLGGQNIKRVNRLKEINIASNSIGFKSYKLEYNDYTALKYDYLQLFTEFNGDKTKSYNPIRFDYTGTSNSISYYSNPNILSVDNANSLNSATVSGDFDGDNNMDFLLYPTTGPNAKSKLWLFTGVNPNTGAQTIPNIGSPINPGSFDEIFPVSFLTWNSKMSPSQGWVIVQGNTFKTFSLTLSQLNAPQGEKTYNFPRFVLDYYYDCSGFSGQQSQISLLSEPIDPDPSEPTPAHYESDIPHVFISGDFNGDGLTDIVAIEKSFTYPYTIGCTTVNQTYNGGRSFFINLDRRLTSNFANGGGVLQTTNNSKIQVADFNGDGKSDIYVFDNGVVKIYSLNDSKSFVLLSQFQHTSIVLNKPILIGDFNGDGKSDYMVPFESNAGWYRFISTGLSFVKEDKSGIKFFLNDSYNSYNYTTTDYDNDGKNDFNRISNSRNGATGTIAISSYTETQPNTFYAIAATTTAQSNIDIYAMPIFLPSTDRRNSRFEIAFINNNKLHFFKSEKNTSQDKLITTITTGNGAQDFITYQPLDQNYKVKLNPVFNPSGGTENYPYFDIVSSPDFQIVNKLERKSANVSKVKFYGYYGAVTNYEGLGFLGFRSMMESNWHNDTYSPMCTITNRDFRRRGAVTESYFLPYLSYPYSGFSSTSYTTKTTFSYTPVAPEDALLPNKVFKQQNTSILSNNGVHNTSSQTTSGFDQFNNLLTSSTLSKEAGTTIQTSTTTVEYQAPIVTQTQYILGRPSSKTQIVTVQPNNSTITSKEAYYYNSRQLLDYTVKTATGAPTITEKNDSYDVFGNIKTKTLSGPTLSRVTKFEYDTSGRFLTKITDPNLLSTTFEYYSENGNLKKITDPYSQSVSYTYDSWFKMLTETDDKLNATTGKIYTKNGKETTITTTTKSNTDGTLDTTVSEEKLDDLGRITRSGSKDLNGAYSYISYLYDIYDRPYKVSEPYFDASPTQWNETKYDIYGRPTDNISFNNRTVSTSYPGLKTIITDGQKTKELTSNAIGNTISSLENTSGIIKYTYFANGALNKASYNDIDITSEYNAWGVKTKLIDPSAGTYTYNNNDFGEIESEIIEGAGITTTLVRDPANGKVTKKTIVGSGTDSETTYLYDGILPLTITYKDNKEPTGTNIIVTKYIYDPTYKRVTSIEEDKASVSNFKKSFTYDALGRVATETKTAKVGNKTSSIMIKNVYKNGTLFQIVDVNNKVIWQANSFNAKGQIKESIIGNGIKMTYNYNTDGYLSTILHDKTTTPTSNVLTLTTAFNKDTDYLDSRINSAFNNYKESFKYDELGRLKTFTNRLGIEENQTYDVTGKINTNGLGTYNYDPTKKYQNTSIIISPEATGYYANREGIFSDSMEDKIGWGIQKYPATNFYSFDTTKTPHATGKNTLKLSNTTATEQYVFSDKWVDVNNTAATQYTYSAWVYSDNPQSEIVLYMKDAAGATTVASTLNNTKGAWTQIVGTFSVPANIKKLCIRLDNNGLGNIWYDDVEIRKTSDPTSIIRSLIVSYNAFKSPIDIEETNVDKISFTYNDDNQRSIMRYGGFQDKLQRPLWKHYSADGSMEVKENKLTNTFEFITYIGGDGYTAPIAVKSDGAAGTTPNYLYLHRDYQGTILAISDANGAVVEKRLFDAWGNIVKVQDGSGNILNGLTVLDRGYTGHEHLQSIGLINMNARLYDPILHRFLQVDNLIQDPTNTQNYNQYGYVQNNPLLFTDRSGNFCEGCGAPIYVGPGSEHGTPFDVDEFDKDYKISRWWKRNINGDAWSDGIKSARNFISTNFKSAVKDVSSWFTKESDPPINLSNYVNIQNNLAQIPGASNNMQRASFFDGKVSLFDIANVGIGFSGFSIAQVQNAMIVDAKILKDKNTLTALAKLAKLKTGMAGLDKVARGLGITGVALTAGKVAYDFTHGKDLTAGQVADVLISVGLAALTISNPVALVGFGVYGLLDATGALDPIKKSLGGDTVLIKSNFR